MAMVGRSTSTKSSPAITAAVGGAAFGSSFRTRRASETGRSDGGSGAGAAGAAWAPRAARMRHRTVRFMSVSRVGFVVRPHVPDRGRLRLGRGRGPAATNYAMHVPWPQLSLPDARGGGN